MPAKGLPFSGYGSVIAVRSYPKKSDTRAFDSVRIRREGSGRFCNPSFCFGHVRFREIESGTNRFGSRSPWRAANSDKMPRIECFQQFPRRGPESAAKVQWRERLNRLDHRLWGIISAKFPPQFFDAGRHQLMRFSETSAFAPDQRIGEFGNGKKVRSGALRHANGIYLASTQHASKQLECTDRVVVAPNTSGCRSSSASFMSPNGVLCRQVKIPWA